MQSLIKNSFIIFICLFLWRCNQVSVSNESGTFHVNKDSVTESAPTFTILTAGLPPPFLYQNAEKIIAKEYNIKFVFAAGCIISDRLSDSISKFNENSFAQLKAFYKRDVLKELYPRIEQEAAHLTKLDSVIEQKNEIKRLALTDNVFKNFSKSGNNYNIYFIVSEQNKHVTEKEPRIWLQKLKLVVNCDSLGKTINNISPKDSLVNSLYDF